jgi:hypothetical protein
MPRDAIFVANRIASRILHYPLHLKQTQNASLIPGNDVPRRDLPRHHIKGF